MRGWWPIGVNVKGYESLVSNHNERLMTYPCTPYCAADDLSMYPTIMVGDIHVRHNARLVAY